MVRTPSGEFTANIAEMDEAIRAAWAPVNTRYEATPEPSVDKFMQEYRHHVRHSAMKARMLTGDVLLQRARKMGVKTANGLDLWSIGLLKRLPTPFWDALAELVRMVERTGKWPDRVAGFTSLVRSPPCAHALSAWTSAPPTRRSVGAGAVPAESSAWRPSSPPRGRAAPSAALLPPAAAASPQRCAGLQSPSSGRV